MSRPPEPPFLADPGLLDAIFAAAGAGLCLLDPGGSVLLANRALLAMTGLTEEQALGRSMWELFPGSPPELRALHDRARGGEALRVPPHPQWIRGQEHWYEGSLAPVPMRGGTGILITAVDITQRRRAEEGLARAERRQGYLLALSDALRELGDPVEVEREASRILGEYLGASRVHYAEVVEGGQVGVVRADYHPGTFSVAGRHRFDDHGATVMAEFRAGRTLVVEDVETDPRLGPAEREATRALAVGSYVIQPLVKEGAAVAVLVVHHAGPRAWSEDDLAVTSGTAERTWAAIARTHAEAALREGIDARRQTEERLGASEGRFRAIFEQAAVGIAELDGRSGRFLRVNDRLCEILARPREALLALRWQDVTHPDDLALDLLRWESFQREAQPYTREKRYLLPGGAPVWVELTVAPMGAPDGGPCSAVSVVQDVTDRKRGEEARRGLEEQLRQAQKLESVGRLAGGVAHDFNNLLTVILSCAGALEEAVAAGRPASLEEVREIRTAGLRAADLTRQLLAFARKQVIAPVPLDLDAVVRASERLLHRVLGEDVNLVVRPPLPGLWRVLADRGQVEQVILNLAVNARDAMPGGGALTIETANLDLRGDAERPPEVAPGEYVRLRVQDTGEGMTPEVMTHLFEPFFTTKPVGHGTGLGLATVYGIVKQSGGAVRAESPPGRGTTFDVFLPRTLRREVPGPEPSPGCTRGTEGVLVVEDDTRVREVTVRTLRGAGYAVTVAASPREALSLGEEALSAIRLLLTDVVMPGLDGRTLAEALRPRRPGLRVLFLSGYPQDVIAARGVIDSGIEFLAKPFTGPALLERVRAVLDAPAVEADGR